MQTSKPKKKVVPKQTQNKQPGIEAKMKPTPEFDDKQPGSGKLKGKKCIITGGDSGIGRAVAIAYAKQGADVAILHLKTEQEDANETLRYIEEHFGTTCIAIAVDIAEEKNCIRAVERIVKNFEQIDVLVNNAAVQYPQQDILKISEKQLVETFAVNIFAMFYMVKAALPYMQKGSNIINTTSVTAYRGSGGLIDYSATKGAIVSFTRSLSSNLIEKGIRVNGVAPGPIWTPLIPATFDGAHVETFGSDTPMQRPGQPSEVAPAFVFLACDDAKYMTGQVLHVNGGEIVNG